MSRATRRRSTRDDEPEREDASITEPEGRAVDVLRLQRAAGNQAVAAALATRAPERLARNATGAPPIKDRAPIDDLAKKKVTAVERVREYARIAGTQAVGMNPAVVNDKGPHKEGVNLGTLKQADEVGAQAGFIDANDTFSGGEPPATAKGVAIVVYSSSTRFEDEDFMVAAIRHEMVHARLMKLTLKHLAAWKQAGGRLSFAQYVDQHVKGTEGALIKDRYFGGHMDETLAYAEGFLTAFFYSPIEKPQAGDRGWIAHLKGFTEAFQTARLNSGPLPKKLPPGVQESTIAMKQSATAVEADAEKLVKEFCDGGGAARRENLAAWMQFLYKSEGMYDAALKMIYRVATGKAMPEPKR